MANYYLFSGCVVFFCICLSIYRYQRYATNEISSNVFIGTKCDYSSYKKDNAPNKCGRILIDDFITDNEVTQLRDILEIAYYHSSGGGIGGPTIFDLISGALSSGTEFIDGYRKTQFEYKQHKESHKYFNKNHLTVLREIMNKIEPKIRFYFSVPQNKKLYITPPTFFSKIFANRIPKQLNDEYFHYHNDTVAYENFCYTVLIYLSDYGKNKDFQGGVFDFKNGQTVTPQKGKLLLMSSGGENEHRVINVTQGIREAFIMAWTLDATKKAGKSDLFLSEKDHFFH